jgi:pantoate--beta-alanine ligase
MTQRVTAAVAFGANLGDRERTFKRALSRLERTDGLTVLRRSPWIETEPVGGPPGQPAFLNGVVLVETTLAPRALLAVLQAIEGELGRDRAREGPSGPRTLDLDLLFHGAARVDEEGLTVPHPRMDQRLFVLEPLAAVAPEQRLACGRTAAQQLALLRAGGRALARLGTPAAAREWCAERHAAGARIGFVPTMGALHEGHLDLARRARAENDAVVASVFVNPLQFDDPADLERYPRDLDGDAALLAGVGADMLFTGTLAGFFPGELDAAGRLPAARLLDPGPAAAGLEGAQRPGHFAGVATIVARLFDVTRPQRAYFGQKDFQQCLVVRDLARRSGGPEIVVCPTRRAPSGLALSSRNRLLDVDGREQALCLSRALARTAQAWDAGERDVARLTGVLRGVLDDSRLAVEYAELRDPRAWTETAPRGALAHAVALVAARAGAVRLIDNRVLSEDDRP